MDYSQGEVYGVNLTPQRFRQRWLRPETPIRGLYLTGQDVTIDGIAGAMIAGILTSGAISKKSLVPVLTSGLMGRAS